MKKLITTMAMSLLSVIAMAQPEKGAILLFGGGGFNASTNTTERPFGNSTVVTDNKTNNLNIDFGAGYFLTDNISLLAGVMLNNSSSKVGDTKTNSTFTSGGMVGARYYHPCFAPRFYTYGELGVAFTAGSSTSYDPSTGDEVGKDILSNVSVGINPGFSYFLTPAVALEMSFGLLGWSQNNRENNADPDIRDVNSQFDFFLNSKALTLGFCWYLGRSERRFPPS